MTKIYAWIAGVTSQEIPKLLSIFGGKVGGVLYSYNYDLLLTPGNWIAFVGNLNDAKKLVKTGGRVVTALIEDEVNITGLSGPARTPESYATGYNLIYDLLHQNGIAVSTGGLAGQPGWASYMTFNTKFDAKYFSKMMPLLHGADYNAFNPGQNRLQEIERILGTYTDRKWLFSPHPLNPQWWPLKWNNIPAYILENYIYHENMDFWIKKSKDPRLLGIAIWSLRYNWMNIDGKRVLQRYCNLLTEKNELTVVGRQLQRGLK